MIFSLLSTRRARILVVDHERQAAGIDLGFENSGVDPIYSPWARSIDPEKDSDASWTTVLFRYWVRLYLHIFMTMEEADEIFPTYWIRYGYLEDYSSCVPPRTGLAAVAQELPVDHPTRRSSRNACTSACRRRGRGQLCCQTQTSTAATPAASKSGGADPRTHILWREEKLSTYSVLFHCCFFFWGGIMGGDSGEDIRRIYIVT